MAEKPLEFIITAKDLASSVFQAIGEAATLAFTGPMGALNAFADGIFGIQNKVATYFDQSIFKLAKIGGAYQEQITQFNLLADANSKNGAEILEIVDKVALGMTSLSDKVKIGTKAITSGLSGPEMESTLAYVKKFTEATGGDFAGMAEQVFMAFSSGRTAILKQMGLFVEDGESASSIAKKMGEAMIQFGDAGFNTGDKINKINNRVGEFVTFIGQAINASEAWQRVMTYVSNGVESFVKSFDYARVGAFFEGIIRAGEIVYVALEKTFGDTFKYIRDTFAKLGSNGGVQEFFNFVVNGFISIAKGVMNAFQSIGNAVVPTFGIIFGSIMVSAGQAFDGLKKIAISAAGGMTDIFLEAVMVITKQFAEMANSPMGVAAGLDTDAILEFDAQLFNAKNNAKDFFSTLAEGAETPSALSKSVQDAGKNISESLGGIKFDFGDRFAVNIDEMKKSMADFKLPELPKAPPRDLEAAQQYVKELEALKKLEAGRKELNKERIEAIKEAKAEEWEIFKSQEEKVIDSYKKQQKAAEEAYEASLSDEEKAFRRRQEDEGIAFKKSQEGLTGVYRDEFGNIIKNMTKEQYDAFRAMGEEDREKEALLFKRKQEDDLIAFKAEQDAKKNLFKDQQSAAFEFEKEQRELAKRDFEKQQKQDITRETGDILKDKALKPLDSKDASRADKDSQNLQKLADAEKKKEEASQRTEQKGGLTLQILPSGNNALDQLADFLLQFYELQAAGEAVKVIAG